MEKIDEDNIKEENLKSDNDNLKFKLLKFDIDFYLAKDTDNVLFYLVNPVSGAKEGKCFIDLGVNYFNFEYPVNSKNTNVSGTETSESEHNDLNLEFKVAKNTYHIYIFDITSIQSFEKGIYTLSLILNSISSTNKVKFIIGGGDGSVLSVIETLLNEYKMNLEKCIFGIIPLGTGNDLSNTMGFGSSVSIKSTKKSIEKLSRKYIEAEETVIDIWKVKLKLDDTDGMLIQNSNSIKDTKKDKNGNIIRLYTKSFINYLSLGYDARVGFGFEKNRSSYRFFNKFLYFWEGCKKNCCRKTMTVKGFLKAFKILEKIENNDSKNENDLKEKLNSELEYSEKHKIENNENNGLQKQITDYSIHDESIINNKFKLKPRYKGSKVIILSEDESDHDADDKITNYPLQRLDEGEKNKLDLDKKSKFVSALLKGDPVSLICQNITYYMGGTGNIWKKSGNSIGVDIIENKGIEEKLDKESYENQRRNTLNSIGVLNKQSYNDQKLEFFSYNSGIVMGMEKIVTGLADKIYQGGGPIFIEFKDTPKFDENDKTNRVYMNIDGEYYHVVKPINILIYNNKQIFNGQIPFLKRKKITS